MLWRRKRDPRDFEAEIRSHLALEADDLRSEGVQDPDAAAHRAFGNVTSVRERSYERGRWAWSDELRQDLRYSLRTMRRSPAYTAGAALLLALGIGANTAVFSFVEAVMLRRLPVPDPDSLVLLKWSAKSNPKVKRRHSGESHNDPKRGYVSGNFPYRAFDVLAANHVFSDTFAFYAGGDVTALARGRAERVKSMFVSGQFFSGLRLAPSVGRTLSPEDDRPAATPVAVLSYSYWQARFGESPDAVGQTILVNNTPFVVAGVTPKGFVGLDTGSDAHVYLPLRFCQSVRSSFANIRDSIYEDDHWYWLQVMGRLKPGVSRSRAEGELAASWAGWVSGTVETEAQKSDLPALYLMSGAAGLDFLRVYYSRPLFVLAGMAGLILAIACANLANLQLSRASARRREILLRFGLGAGRGRIARQLLTESMLLSACGGALSVLFAWAGMRGLSALAEGWRETTFRAELNWTCLLASAALTLLTGLLFGMAPALHAWRLQLASGLREARIGRSSDWLRRGGLVPIQIALSLILIVGAGLFVRTLSNLRAVSLGFNPDRVLAFEADAYQAGHRGDAMGRFYGEALSRLRAIPGAHTATAASYSLVAGDKSGTGVSVPGNPTAGEFGTAVMWVGPEFFAALQIPIVLGREFNDRDITSAPMVVVVNEAFAAKHLPPGNPVGQTIRFETAARPIATIVGVARNTLVNSLKKETEPMVFGAYPQQLGRITRMTFLIRAVGDSLALAAPARRIIETLDSRVPVIGMRTLESQIDSTIGQERLFAFLCSVFAGLALLIASVGLYGTLAYGVSRRAGEIGVRIALGARRGRVVTMILRESVAMILAGLAIGLPFVWFSGKVIGSFLFRAAPEEPGALAPPVLVLLVSALIAAGIPAWRAARIDPIQALRHE